MPASVIPITVTTASTTTEETTIVKEPSKFALAIRASLNATNNVAHGTASGAGAVTAFVGLGKAGMWTSAGIASLANTYYDRCEEVFDARQARKADKK